MATKPMYVTQSEAVRSGLPSNEEQFKQHNLRVRLEKETPRLSVAQANRMVDILAMGPLVTKGVDVDLLSWGWLEFYDDESVIAVDGAEKIFYDSLGCISDVFIPLEWRERARRNRAMMGGK